MSLRKLAESGGRPETDTSQRFLLSSFEAVDAVLDNLRKVRTLRKTETGDIRGRLTANEEDLLRAAIVFTGAGLDSTLKQLIRDALPQLLETNPHAHEKFESYAAERIRAGERTDPGILARYLVSASSPRERLIEDYIYDLTGSSLQSAEEVQKVAGALGIEDASLRKRMKGLTDLFIARNKISHELDLQRPEKQGDRARQSRRIQPTKDLCHEGLEVAQLMINAVGALL